MIGLLAIHCWDVYAERENQKVIALVERGAEKVEEGVEQAGHGRVHSFVLVCELMVDLWMRSQDRMRY